MFRYPAIPLIAHDPFFSVWCPADHLYDQRPVHWTDAPLWTSCKVAVDGKIAELISTNAPTKDIMPQVDLQVLPTRTIATFKGLGVRIKLTFMTPALLDNLAVLSRPVTYIVFTAESIDKKKHDVRFWYSADPDLVINDHNTPVTWGRFNKKGMDYLQVGAADQNVLGQYGDVCRTNWGYLVMAVSKSVKAETCVERYDAVNDCFTQRGALPSEDNTDIGTSFFRNPITLNSLLKVTAAADGKAASTWFALAYNDRFSIEYLNTKLKGYWTKFHKDFNAMLACALEDYEELVPLCEATDKMVMDRATAAGGEGYARLLGAAYRQAIAAHKLVLNPTTGRPYFFSKENNSNGCVATMDVTYPSAPLFLLLSPELLKGMLWPILDYARTPRWKFPFAPHDLGTFPLANGQVYGGCEETEEDQMPVEESGNILILAAALLKLNDETEFVTEYEDLLRIYANYLLDKGFDPEKQLCTDDFAGHLAHNTNLSLKAIIALASWAYIAGALGHKAEAAKFRKTAETFAKKWVKQADDGDHFRLAFDQPNTWSQKYNLVWDRLLDFNLFPKAVAEKELAFYKKHQNAFGLPLDSRKTYTKIDWILWSATLTGKKADFQALLKPVLNWIENGVDRVPMSDWYETVDDGKHYYFRARSVVGGLFIKLLDK